MKIVDNNIFHGEMPNAKQMRTEKVLAKHNGTPVLKNGFLIFEIIFKLDVFVFRRFFNSYELRAFRNNLANNEQTIPEIPAEL